MKILECLEALLQPIHFSRVRLPGDPVDPISVPPGKDDVASLLPRMTASDSLVLCYSDLTLFDNLPGVGQVVAMIGSPEDPEKRHYAMLVYEFVEFAF